MSGLPEVVSETQVDPTFRVLVESMPGGYQIRECIQCGTCTGSCPVSSKMEYTPRRIIEMVRAGLRREVLSSDTIWYCASCYSCAVRCPKGIKLTEVMYVLRTMAARGSNDRSAVFYRCFADVIKRYGRINEVRLIMSYNQKTRTLKPNRLIGLGYTLLSKRKLKLLPARIRGLEEVQKLFEIARVGGA